MQALGHAALAVNRKLVLTHIASPDLEQETKVKVSQRSIFLALETLPCPDPLTMNCLGKNLQTFKDVDVSKCQLQASVLFLDHLVVCMALGAILF
jgi:hypothetical protein